ncbi:riboflavin synthase [Populibacterium corticicola]|uniref:Riboflavin synthase n=1 Tax=Populibacterium corticicola TaxID=1812826 RepID=A0ABW5XER5_9MICO
MFTGIITEIGTIVATDSDATVSRNVHMTISAPQSVQGTALGGSIAVNGACLTVTSFGSDGSFTVDVMPESLRHTTLGELEPGSRVNLEPAITHSARLDGHIVQGHVDGVGTLESRNDGEAWTDLRFRLPEQLARYVASKGSVAVAGVSLTVTEVGPDWFGVSLIPTTLEHTILGDLREGSRVNIEVDVIAKYVERLLAAGATPTAALPTAPEVPAVQTPTADSLPGDDR